MSKRYDYTTPLSNSSSGVRGVSFIPDRNEWEAKICYNRKRVRLGRFPTLEEAKAAYDAAAQRVLARIEEEKKLKLERNIQSLFD